MGDDPGHLDGALDDVADGGPDITVVAHSGDWAARIPDAEAICRRAARTALEGADAHAAKPRALPRSRSLEIAIVLADDPFIQELNRDYRGKDRPTNVLSFPSGFLDGGEGDPGEGPLALGDVVVSLSTLAREAAEKPSGAQALTDHLAHLVMHGVLHLLGYDHETEADAAVMEELEIALLADLGIANPYDEPHGAAVQGRAQSPRWRRATA